MRFKSLANLVKQNEEIPISNLDVKKICDGKVNIVLYSDLKELYKRDISILSLFKEEYNNCIVLLYQLGRKIGHWVSLILHNDMSISFYNSYAFNIDQELDFTTHGSKYLTLLLHGHRVNVNPYRHQRLIENVNTCGLHASLRCVFHHFTNEQYHKFISSYDNHKTKDYDKLVSLLCLVPLKYNIARDEDII